MRAGPILTECRMGWRFPVVQHALPVLRPLPERLRAAAVAHMATWAVRGIEWRMAGGRWEQLFPNGTVGLTDA